LEVTFANNRLEACYVSRSAAIREWGPAAGARFGPLVDLLYNVADRNELSAFRFLRLHPLRGQRAGQWAVVLHDRWRVILSFSDETVRIEEVSQHYGD
jgi:plasmid maintenance system killer protein